MTLDDKTTKDVIAAFCSTATAPIKKTLTPRKTSVPRTLGAPYGGKAVAVKPSAPAVKPTTPKALTTVATQTNPNPTRQTTTMSTAPAPAPPASNIIREIRLIYSDVIGNNNKLWKGVLYTNGDVFTEWGRVGKSLQTKTYHGAGARKLDEKEREKLNKGYTHAQVVASVPSDGNKALTVPNGNLQDIAIKQIAKSEPVLTRLITMLVKANIHQITAHSQITYNNTTGLFQTPLGVVTASAIQEAYDDLATIQAALQGNRLASVGSTINHYLRLIPQDFGMRLDINAMFPNDRAIQKQKDLLDALEASYNTVTTAKPVPPAAENASPKEDNLFEVTVTLCDQKEVDRVRKLYKKTKQSAHHHVANMDVKAVYEVHMPTQRARFEAYGKTLQNIWELWHGTKMANVLNILRTGLKIAPPRTAAIAGKMFGNGCYFSDQSSKSLNYATDYWHGGGKGRDTTFFMFLAQVAMGNYNVPSGSRSCPPPKGYDSYFAKAGQSSVYNNEMIVFNEGQFDIVRLVEFSEYGK